MGWTQAPILRCRLDMSNRCANILNATQDHRPGQSSVKVIPADKLGRSSAKLTSPHITGRSTENIMTAMHGRFTENLKSTVNFAIVGVNGWSMDTYTTTDVLGQSAVDLTTTVMLGCLNNSNSSLVTLEADEVWLSVDYTGNMRRSPLLRTRATCRLLVRGHDPGVMSLLVFNVTCSSANRLVVHSPMLDRDGYDCDPALWMAPGTELVMKSNSANISIDIRDVRTAFNLRARFRILPENKLKKLEIRKVTEYFGAYVFRHTYVHEYVHAQYLHT